MNMKWVKKMLYSCKPLFERIKTQIANEIKCSTQNIEPKVCIIVAGNDEPSARYVRNKLRDFADVGIKADVKRVSTFCEFKRAVYDCFFHYDGVIIQRPILLSDATHKEAHEWAMNVISPSADIDGICYKSPFMPPSVRGLDLLLKEWDYDPSGKSAVVLGRGDVGRPVMEYLLGRNATVTIAHSKTTQEQLWNAFVKSDIVIGAAGLKNPIYPMCWARDRVVIDYGITKGDDGKLHGDIHSDHADRCLYQTSIPGGMGLMVRAGLLLNIMDAYKMRRRMK